MSGTRFYIISWIITMFALTFITVQSINSHNLNHEQSGSATDSAHSDFQTRTPRLKDKADTQNVNGMPSPIQKRHSNLDNLRNLIIWIGTTVRNSSFVFGLGLFCTAMILFIKQYRKKSIRLTLGSVTAPLMGMIFQLWCNWIVDCIINISAVD